MAANPVTESDREFAGVLIALALMEPDPEMAAYLANAADWHCPASPHRCSAGVRLAMAGLERQESAR